MNSKRITTISVLETRRTPIGGALPYLVALYLFAPLQPCQARGWKSVSIYFGKSEALYALTDVPLKGPAGEDLTLGYKTTKYIFGLGLFCKDDGYVLLNSARSDHYFPFPPAPEVRRWQDAGILPTPLPGYQVPLLDRFIGFSFWLVALVAAMVLGLNDHFTRRQAHRSANLGKRPGT